MMRLTISVARACGIAGAFWLSLLLVTPVGAQELFVQVNSYALNLDRAAYTHDQVQARTLVAGPEVQSFVASPLNDPDPYFVRALARADYGVLGVSAEASMDRSRPQVLANAMSSWTDTFTIASGSAPDGTPVTILTTMVVDIGQLTASSFGDNALSYGWLTFNTSNQPGSGWCLAGAAGVGAAGITCDASSEQLHVGRNLISFETQTTVGSHTWAASLYAGANVSDVGLWPFGAGHAFVDAIHTARSYFTVLTPGATMQWASDHDYGLPPVQAIPEPSTYALMLAGLGALGFVARRRRRH